MNCYLSRNYKDLNSAGNKAKSDIESIMRQMGFRNVGFRQTSFRNTVLAFLVTLAGVLKAPFCLRKGDRLVLQYPLKKYFSFVCNLAHLRGAEVIVIIHDLGCFRRKKLTAKQEIARLSHADYIISHNANMRRWLLQQGCPVPVGILQIFDYLSGTKCPVRESPGETYRVLYAGALNYRKNTFLYEIGSHIHSFEFVLYGNGFEMEKAKGKERLRYKGFVRSDNLIKDADGDFGLVWDGDSIDECSGDWGSYLKFNNPHKTSLYLRCGLPVIIWSKAALAGFIKENGVGLCIDSLQELDSVLSGLSADDYRSMKANVMRISERLSEGYYCRHACLEAIEYLNGGRRLQ